MEDVSLAEFTVHKESLDLDEKPDMEFKLWLDGDGGAHVFVHFKTPLSDDDVNLLRHAAVKVALKEETFHG